MNGAGVGGNTQINDADGHEEPEAQLGMEGLMMHDREIPGSVEEEGGGEELLVLGLGVITEEMGEEVDEPVDGEEHGALCEFREKPVSTEALVGLIEPEPVDGVGGDDGEGLDGVPLALAEDNDE